MVPLAPSHRNSVGIGLWYFETGCGELQLGKNRICDGVAILAAASRPCREIASPEGAYAKVGFSVRVLPLGPHGQIRVESDPWVYT